MQNIVTEALKLSLSMEKMVLSANHVVIVFSIKLDMICKPKDSRKVLWLKQI